MALSILKKLRPFSFTECLHLISKTDEASKSLKEKDVSVYFGTSGSGKTTTLLYSSGVPMKKVLLNGLPHIKPDYDSASCRGDLKDVRVSPFAKSETRYVRAVTISLSDVGLSPSDE